MVTVLAVVVLGGGTAAELPLARLRLRTHEKTVSNNEASRVTFDNVVEDNAGMAGLRAGSASTTAA